MTERPTPAGVRKARKAELVGWCETFGLNAEGKVDELRGRILDYLATPEEEAAPPKGEEPAAEAPAEEPEEAEEEEAEEEAEEEPEEEEAPKGKKKAKAKEEEEAFTPKLKPTIEPAVRRLLDVRRSVASRRPRFVRQEWFRYKRLGEVWRNPHGMHSKLHRHWGYRPNVPSIGYRGPRAVRGLHPSGFREVLIHTVRELDAVDPKVEAVRIAGSVGTRRRTEIQAAADEKGIRILNRREEE